MPGRWPDGHRFFLLGRVGPRSGAGAAAQQPTRQLDRHDEIEAVESFVEALRCSIAEFQQDPLGTPFLSAWVRVRAGIPGFSKRLREAVEADNSESR